MVQSTDPGQLNHLGAFGWSGLNRTLNGSVLPESIMGSIVMIVIEIRGQDPAQVAFAQYDHVIKTIPVYRAN